MADRPPIRRHGASRRGRASANATPRWVYVFGGIAVVLILLFVILHLTGNSPGRIHSGMQ